MIGVAKCGFQSGIGEIGGISFCLENMAACGFQFGIGEMGNISSRGGHVRAFTYNYVKTRTEHPAPHDLSASQSEAPRSECVVIDVTKCSFRSGFGEMSSISFYLESAIASGFRYSIAEMASISTRGGHVRALTYDYVKTYLDLSAPHDLSASPSEAARSECVVPEATLGYYPSARLIQQAQTSSFNFTNFTNLMTIASVLSKTSPALGSSSFITDATGYATQHLQYLPFGETFVDQQNGYDSRYTFSAKEKDDETQYSYFGARYYDSDLSVWLSVDAMSDEYPELSPYCYVGNNPVNAIDPDGNKIILLFDGISVFSRNSIGRAIASKLNNQFFVNRKVDKAFNVKYVGYQNTIQFVNQTKAYNAQKRLTQKRDRLTARGRSTEAIDAALSFYDLVTGNTNNFQVVTEQSNQQASSNATNGSYIDKETIDNLNDRTVRKETADKVSSGIVEDIIQTISPTTTTQSGNSGNQNNSNSRNNPNQNRNNNPVQNPNRQPGFNPNSNENKDQKGDKIWH
ncbi:MAG: RHS repeat domain-containing protein [Bacteroidales bacterium]